MQAEDPANPNGQQPKPASRVKIAFPKRTPIDNRAVPRCIAGAGDFAADGRHACSRRSRVGTGTATLRMFVDGRPASCLYAPAEGGTLVYAHLGYDPDHAALSPGTVLSSEKAAERSFSELFVRSETGLGSEKALPGH